jgi:hypothetical protein
VKLTEEGMIRHTCFLTCIGGNEDSLYWGAPRMADFEVSILAFPNPKSDVVMLASSTLYDGAAAEDPQSNCDS